MVAGVQASCAASDAGFMAFSGVKSIGKALDGLEGLHPDKNLFIELLACEGGCVNGPSTADQKRVRTEALSGDSVRSTG